jgi:hypothetical protein
VGLYTLLLVTVLSQAQGPHVGPDQFARLMESHHAAIQDVSFVYEGRDGGVPPSRTLEGVLAEPVPGESHTSFQGEYSFRSDGATRLDSFDVMHYDGRDINIHQIAAIFAGKCSKVTQFPDHRGEKGTASGGGRGALNRPCSPERIFYSWYFRTAGSSNGSGYEFQGWELVDGHRCLKVQFDERTGHAARPPGSIVTRFYIDMERGGHPLKVEFMDRKGLRMRAVDIQLAEVSLPDGRQKWFPMRGRLETFVTTDPSYTIKPIGYEIYSVVGGTVRFNQKLPDRFFSIDWTGAHPDNATMARLRREFRKPPRRNDPKGLSEYVKTALAEADSQTRQIEASSVARDAWTWASAFQVLLTLTGIGLIVGVGIVKWRSR